MPVATPSFAESVRKEFHRVNAERKRNLAAFQRADVEIRALRAVMNAYAIPLDDEAERDSGSDPELPLGGDVADEESIEAPASGAQLMRDIVTRRPGLKSADVLEAYMTASGLSGDAARRKANSILKYVRSMKQVELREDMGNYPV